jgi:hypothetical protein
MKKNTKRRFTPAPPPAVEEPADETRSTQFQIYAPPELVEWLDQDRAACQDEIQCELGQQQRLSRSAHVVSILHQYSLTRSMHDTSGDASFRDYWTTVNNAVKPQKRAKK